jgi:hypothetical protein
LGYLQESQLLDVTTTRDNCAKMVFGLMKKMERARSVVPS